MCCTRGGEGFACDCDCDCDCGSAFRTGGAWQWEEADKGQDEDNGGDDGEWGSLVDMRVGMRDVVGEGGATHIEVRKGPVRE